MIIFKYPVQTTDTFTIQMPGGAKILYFGLQFNSMQVWAMVNPDRPIEDRKFALICTGDLIADGIVAEQYIGTVQTEGMVYHLFDLGDH